MKNNNNMCYVVFLATNMLWMIGIFILIFMQIIVLPRFGGYMKLDTSTTKMHVTQTLVENSNLQKYYDQVNKNELINRIMEDTTKTDQEKLELVTKYATK